MGLHNKFTPGPWHPKLAWGRGTSRLGYPMHGSVGSASGVNVAQCKHDHEKDFDNYEEKREEMEANALLIAVAPEMFDFVIHVLKSGACGVVPGLEGYGHLMIAKALGGPIEPTEERTAFVQAVLKKAGT